MCSGFCACSCYASVRARCKRREQSWWREDENEQTFDVVVVAAAADPVGEWIIRGRKTRLTHDVMYEIQKNSSEMVTVDWGRGGGGVK